MGSGKFNDCFSARRAKRLLKSSSPFYSFIVGCFLWTYAYRWRNGSYAY